MKNPEGWWDKVQSQVRVKASGAKNAVDTAVQHAQQIAKDNPKATLVAGAALAALAIFGAYKTYKRFFSKAAKACKGSQDRNACLKQYKVKAVQAQISDLKAASGKCGASKDPGKCKASIGNKIQKLQVKAQRAAA